MFITFRAFVYLFFFYRSTAKQGNFNMHCPMMTQKLDVKSQSVKIFLIRKSLFSGYPVTCLKFYSNKEDLKSDHQKMLAATCMSTINYRKQKTEMIFELNHRYGWLCQSLALSNSTMCLHVR